MRIVAIDGSDPGEFARFHELVLRVQRAESEFPTAMGSDEWRVLFGPRSHDRRHSALVSVVDDAWVGAVVLDEPLLENTDKLVIAVYVDPAYRRRGIGTALLHRAEGHARSSGRTVLAGEVEIPYGESASAGTVFAERHGFIRKHVEILQVLRLPVAEAELDRLTPDPGEYRIVQWDDDCPDEWVDRLCAVQSRFGDEVAVGDLQLDSAVWTPERLRRSEARRREQGRFVSTTVAVAPDGTIAGYTKLGGTNADPGRLFQWDTMILPEHRGRRLGRAVKVTNLRRLQDRVGGQAVVFTWNALDNVPMIAVNEALGFVAHREVYLYQR